MCIKKIDYTLSWDKYDLSYLTHFHFRIIRNIIIDFIDHFWCSDLIWTTGTSYGYPRKKECLINTRNSLFSIFAKNSKVGCF